VRRRAAAARRAARQAAIARRRVQVAEARRHARDTATTGTWPRPGVRTVGGFRLPR